MLASLLSLLIATTPTLADAVVDAAEQVCLPPLAGETAWPKDLAAEQALLAHAGMTPGIAPDVIDAIKKTDPRLDSLSRAILASHSGADGSFVLALGGPEQSCPLMAHALPDRAASVAAIDGALTARDWKQVPTPATRYPKHAFLRRTASGRVAIAQLILPVDGLAIGPTLVVEIAPAGMPVPPEFGL